MMPSMEMQNLKKIVVQKNIPIQYFSSLYLHRAQSMKHGGRSWSMEDVPESLEDVPEPLEDFFLLTGLNSNLG